MQNDLLDMDPRKKSLVAGLSGIAPGEGAPNAAPAPVLDQPMAAPPMADAPAAPDYRKTGKYASNAYDPGKLARPWEEQSEKYQIGNVLSNFDPKQGFSPEVLDALNKANIHGAKFSGSGDKLTVDNAGGYDRFGKGGTADAVTGFHSDHPTWGAWHVDDEGGGQAPPQVGGGGMALPMLGGGDAQSNIAAQLAQLSTQSPNLAALIKQLGGNS